MGAGAKNWGETQAAGSIFLSAAAFTWTGEVSRARWRTTCERAGFSFSYQRSVVKLSYSQGVDKVRIRRIDPNVMAIGHTIERDFC